MYRIKKTETIDLVAIADLFRLASTTMGILGIPQWQKGYPSVEVVEEDMQRGESYVLVEDDDVIGTFMMTTEENPDYAEIDGKWVSDEAPYVSVHRITVRPDCRETFNDPKMRYSASAFIMDYIKTSAKKRGAVGGVRIDTHEKNEPMKKMLAKNGFVHCGTIHLTSSVEKGEPREAYQFVG